jgi:uncharacterized damage-inducible protein DinB
MKPTDLHEYWTRVRRRTDAVVDRVPADRVDWSPGCGAMTFGDLTRHLALTERWLFVEVACGRPSRYDSHDSRWGASLPEIRAMMSRLHDESLSLLAAFAGPDWERRVMTPAGASMPAWKWLRAMCEHEIHHRGQLYLMLRMCGIATPPIFGLTSEEVRARAVRT